MVTLFNPNTRIQQQRKYGQDLLAQALRNPQGISYNPLGDAFSRLGMAYLGGQDIKQAREDERKQKLAQTEVLSQILNPTVRQAPVPRPGFQLASNIVNQQPQTLSPELISAANVNPLGLAQLQKSMMPKIGSPQEYGVLENGKIVSKLLSPNQANQLLQKGELFPKPDKAKEDKLIKVYDKDTKNYDFIPTSEYRENSSRYIAEAPPEVKDETIKVFVRADGTTRYIKESEYFNRPDLYLADEPTRRKLTDKEVSINQLTSSFVDQGLPEQDAKNKATQIILNPKKAPKLRQVIDTSTNEIVFKTEREILNDPQQRFRPVPTDKKPVKVYDVDNKTEIFVTQDIAVNNPDRYLAEPPKKDKPSISYAVDKRTGKVVTVTDQQRLDEPETYGPVTEKSTYDKSFERIKKQLRIENPEWSETKLNQEADKAARKVTTERVRPELSTPEQASQPSGKTLFQLIETTPQLTGVIPGVKSAIESVLATTGAEIEDPEVAQARQTFRLAKNNLIRTLSVNPRFPVAEMQRLLGDIDIQPGILTSANQIKNRLISLDKFLNNEKSILINNLNIKGLSDTAMDNFLQQINAIDSFKNIMGVPKETGGTDGTGVRGDWKLINNVWKKVKVKD